MIEVIPRTPENIVCVARLIRVSEIEYGGGEFLRNLFRQMHDELKYGVTGVSSRTLSTRITAAGTDKKWLWVIQTVEPKGH